MTTGLETVKSSDVDVHGHQNSRWSRCRRWHVRWDEAYIVMYLLKMAGASHASATVFGLWMAWLRDDMGNRGEVGQHHVLEVGYVSLSLLVRSSISTITEGDEI